MVCFVGDAGMAELIDAQLSKTRSPSISLSSISAYPHPEVRVSAMIDTSNFERRTVNPNALFEGSRCCFVFVRLSFQSV